MRTQTLIARNTSFLVSAEIISKIVQFVVFVYIARLLGDTKIGVLGFATSFTSLFAIIPRFGFTIFTIREVSRDPTKGPQFFSNIITLKTLLSMIVLFLIVVVSLFIHATIGYRLVLYTVAMTMIVMSFTDFVCSFYRALQRMAWEAIIRSFTIIGAGIVGAFSVYIGWDLIGYVSARLCIYILGLLGLVGFLFTRFYKFRWTLDKEFCKYLLFSSVPFILLCAFTTVNLQIGTVMVSLIKGFQVAGWFNAAYKFLLTFALIPTSFVSAILPALSKTFNKRMENFTQIYSHSMRWLFIIALPFAVLISMRASSIILFVYGESFINSAPALRILMFSLLFFFLSPVVGNVLIAANLQRFAVISAIVTAVVYIILNGILIPVWSYVGASIAFLVAQAVSFVIQKQFADKYVMRINIVSILAKPILSGLLLAITLYLTRELDISTVVPIAVVCYPLYLILTGSVSKGDFFVVKKALTIWRDERNYDNHS